MSQPLSIESSEYTYIITTRTSGSKLWFINNKPLQDKILGVLARCQERYKVLIYSFVLMGNHYHLVARFPECNKASFMRDFNSMVARLVGRYVKQHGRRAVWSRRYSCQVLPRDEDVRNWFYYVGLNPVSSGIVESIDQYPGYNSFHDASQGIVRTYKWIDWSKYIREKRYNPELTPEEFTVEHKLTYSRLPDSLELSPEEYLQANLTELREREEELVKERKNQGKGFLGLKELLKQKIGASPLSTKTSTRYSYRPLVLSLCSLTKQKYLKLYFDILDDYILASKKFRSGDYTVTFPPGTYPPPTLIPIALSSVE